MKKLKGGKMEKQVQITLIIIVGVLILVGGSVSVIDSFLPSNTVTGNGLASVIVVPDLVKIYFNVETKSDTSQQAKNENAEIIDNLITALIKKGFERADIQTQNFNIYPDYTWDDGERKDNGYIATHTLILEFSAQDTDKIGEVIDSGVDAGAGISYINFELSQEKQNQYKAEALKLAAEDAKIKAESIAIGLDKKLGKLISTSDNNFYYSPWRAYSDSGADEDFALEKQTATTIQPSEQEISASVTAIFKLK